MTVGPTDEGADVDMGPVISRAHCQRVTDYLDVAIKEGATVALDGRRIVKMGEGEGEGFLLGPSVLDRVGPQCASPRRRFLGRSFPWFA